jgi:hypothetical protein
VVNAKRSGGGPAQQAQQRPQLHTADGPAVELRQVVLGLSAKEGVDSPTNQGQAGQPMQQMCPESGHESEALPMRSGKRINC